MKTRHICFLVAAVLACIAGLSQASEPPRRHFNTLDVVQDFLSGQLIYGADTDISDGEREDAKEFEFSNFRSEIP